MKNLQKGYTLFELMIVVVLVSILAAGAYVSYASYAERARVSRAIADLGEIHIAIQRFLTEENRGYPASLAEIGLGDLRDPWGNPYQYLIVEGREDIGPVRKDQNLIPVNQQYDIYSIGKDAQTASPLNSNVSEDDVVMAGDGTYFGLGKDF